MLEKSPSSTYRMATACASWLFQASANAATVCLMAAVSASRLDATCERELAAEKVINNKTVSAAFDGTEIIADSYAVNLASGLAQPRNPANSRHHTTDATSLPLAMFFGGRPISCARATRPFYVRKYVQRPRAAAQGVPFAGMLRFALYANRDHWASSGRQDYSVQNSDARAIG